MPSFRRLPLQDSEVLNPLKSEVNNNQYTFEVINRFCGINLHQRNSVNNSHDRLLDISFVNVAQHFKIFLMYHVYRSYMIICIGN